MAWRWKHTTDWTARQLGIVVHAEAVRIHPFVDGNGRARPLADLVFAAAQNPAEQQYDWDVDKPRYTAQLRASMNIGARLIWPHSSRGAIRAAGVLIESVRQARVLLRPSCRRSSAGYAVGPERVDGGDVECGRRRRYRKPLTHLS
ncbi:hypothetical protein DVS77_00460 [Mycolicibacterium moriokaense]|nr:hypothetical protein DVS77_00460 [Mycolicibacterium moriokaense]